MPQCHVLLLENYNEMLDADWDLCMTLSHEQGTIYCACNVSLFTQPIDQYLFYVGNSTLNPLVELLNDFNLDILMNNHAMNELSDNQSMTNTHELEDEQNEIELWDEHALSIDDFGVGIIVGINIFFIMIGIVFWKCESVRDQPLMLFVDHPSSKLKEIKHLEIKILLKTSLYREGYILNMNPDEDEDTERGFEECALTLCLTKWYELCGLKLRDYAWILCWIFRSDGIHLFNGHRIVLIVLYAIIVMALLCIEFGYNQYLIPTDTMTNMGGEYANMLWVCSLISIIAYIPVLILNGCSSIHNVASKDHPFYKIL